MFNSKDTGELNFESNKKFSLEHVLIETLMIQPNGDNQKVLEYRKREGWEQVRK